MNFDPHRIDAYASDRRDVILANTEWKTNRPTVALSRWLAVCFGSDWGDTSILEEFSGEQEEMEKIADRFQPFRVLRVNIVRQRVGYRVQR